MGDLDHKRYMRRAIELAAVQSPGFAGFFSRRRRDWIRR